MKMIWVNWNEVDESGREYTRREPGVRVADCVYVVRKTSDAGAAEEADGFHCGHLADAHLRTAGHARGAPGGALVRCG